MAGSNNESQETYPDGYHSTPVSSVSFHNVSHADFAHFYTTDPSSDKMAGPASSDVETVENVINLAVLPILAAIGVTTNVINMAVFKRQGLSDRINVCLLSLALADLCYLVLLIVGKSYSFLSLVDRTVGQRWRVTSVHTVVGVYWGLMTTSNVITMIIALERCICVLAPLHAKRLLSARSMGMVMVAVFVGILGLYGIYDVMFITVAIEDPLNANSTIYVARLSSFYLQNKAVIDVIYNYFLSVTIPTTSLVIVIICTIITVVQLRLSLAWRKGTTTTTTGGVKDSKEVALTKMLVAVCCVYVVCITPSVIRALVVQLWPEFLPTGRYSDLFYAVTSIMHVLSALNSSVNFFFYCALGSRYRATLRSLCSCRHPENNKMHQLGSALSNNSGSVTTSMSAH